jgi:tetratricopeptide (TPR) repeat protein
VSVKKSGGRDEAVLDRIEDRLRDASDGLHTVGAPASVAALEASGIDADERAVWTRWDGIELLVGEARLLALAEIAGATEQAREAGTLKDGDLVIAERGRDLLVLPSDPWAEGAAVVRVEEAGDRSPEASSVAHLVIGWLGEIAVLYDDHGEFHDELFGEDGELVPAVERRLCRRRLDLDPDAPNARLRLAELLREAGELNAAKAELQQVIKRAPEFAWAHFALGRTLLALEHRDRALAAFRAAAQCHGEAGQQAWFLAWAALAADGDTRAALGKQVLALRPEFAAHQAEAVGALLEREREAQAREQLELGLAVLPGHLELLRLRGELATT